MSDLFFSMLFPPRCPACRGLLEDDGTLIHEECRNLFKAVAAPGCLKCGRHIEDEEMAYCAECEKKKHSYDYGLPALEYNDTAKKAMTDFKFHNWRTNADYFSSVAVGLLKEKVRNYSPQILIPVPVTKKRLHERGFNQAEVLADKIGEGMGIPVLKDVLIKNPKRNIQQKKLSKREREINARLAFECTSEIPYERVCLVDDIYTTGSTLDACAKVLKASGVKEVGFIVICATRLY